MMETIESITLLMRDYGAAAGAIVVMAGALCAYVYRDWGRIKALETRVQNLEDEFRKQVMPILAATQESLKDSTEQVTLSRKVIETFLLKNA